MRSTDTTGSGNRELEAAANAMIAAAGRGQSVRRVLTNHCPQVARQLRRDANFPALLGLWGRSVNYDELARQLIVPPAILRTLGDLAGVPVRGRIVHAGIEHTYGYLFSLIPTPFGFKRERWTSNDLERGFGLDPSLLGPAPRSGTLLSNLSWFIGHIAFRDHTRELNAVRTLAAVVAPELVGFDFERLRVVRIAEQFVGGLGATVRAVTDLVTFLHPSPGPAANTLIVYSTQAGPAARPKLVTAFTMTDTAVNDVLSSARPRGQVDVRLRYNAYVRGCYGRVFRGRRVIELGRRPRRLQN